MNYNILNYFDKDDSLGKDIKIEINGYSFIVGKNVVMHKNINVIGDKNKTTYIGHDTYIGENSTIISGVSIGDRNIILKNSSVNESTDFETVLYPNGEKSTFESFLKKIKRCDKPQKDKINIALAADDFGRNQQANEGIEYYLKNNVLNHTTLMINRGESTIEALEYIKKNHIENLVGLHFNVTEVENKYSVNVKNNFGQKINSGKKEYFFLTHAERKLLKSELISQINEFTRYGLELNYFDSHGHIHLKPSTSKIITKALKDYNPGYVRIPLYSFQTNSFKSKISNLIFKKKIFHRYSINFNHFDFFINSKSVFNLDKSFSGKNIEVMTHPFKVTGTNINRRDIDFSCLLGLIEDNDFLMLLVTSDLNKQH